MSTWDQLDGLSEGDEVSVHIVDFENSMPKDENPRTLDGEVTRVQRDVNHAAGEVQTVVTVGDPWDGGCHIDLGDTAENKATGGANKSRKYAKAWRPRTRKRRRLLGRVDNVEVEQ